MVRLFEKTFAILHERLGELPVDPVFDYENYWPHQSLYQQQSFDSDIERLFILVKFPLSKAIAHILRVKMIAEPL